MPVLSNTQLERLRWSTQSWTEMVADNMQKLEDNLLYLIALDDVEPSGLADGDVLRYRNDLNRWEATHWKSIWPSTTSTTTTTSTTVSTSSTTSTTGTTTTSTTATTTTVSTSSTTTTTQTTSTSTTTTTSTTTSTTATTTTNTLSTTTTTSTTVTTTTSSTTTTSTSTSSTTSTTSSTTTSTSTTTTTTTTSTSTTTSTTSTTTSTTTTVTTTTSTTVPPELLFLLRSDDSDESTDFEDVSDYNESLTAAGDVKHDTAQKKWCKSSIRFDGTGDAIGLIDPWDKLSTGDFTMECWFRPETAMLSAAHRFLARGNVQTTNGAWCWGIGNTWGGGTKMNFADKDTGIVDHLSNALSLTADVWQHFCIERYNGTLYFYVDGTEEGNVSCSHSLTPAGSVSGHVGNRAPNIEYAQGWGEDFAIYNYSKRQGAASFSVPTGPLEGYTCVTTTTTTSTTTTSTVSTTTTTTQTTSTSTTTTTTNTITTTTTLPDTIGGFENLLTFDEEDEDGDIVLTSAKCDVTSIRNDARSWVVKDYGDNFFELGTVIEFEFAVDNVSDNSSIFYLIALADVLGSRLDMVNAGEGIIFGAQPLASTLSIFLGKRNVPTDIDVYEHGSRFIGLTYATLRMLESTIEVSLYSDSDRETEIDTMVIDREYNTKKRYLYPFVSVEGASPANEGTCYTQNFKIVSTSGITTTTTTTVSTTSTTV